MNATIENIKKTSIGLDVSKNTISVYIPNGDVNTEIENNAKGFKKLFSKLKKLYSQS